MAPKVLDNINISNAKIRFRNFSGKEGRFNPAGNRNFAIFLDDPQVARDLQEEGWNIRWLEGKEVEDEKQPMLSVKVAFGAYPPKIVLVSRKGLSQLSEEEIGILDWADIKNVDITIRPYNYEVNGKKGVSAYVKTMYVTIQEDQWENKYVDPPDSAQDSIGGCGDCEICDEACKQRQREEQ